MKNIVLIGPPGSGKGTQATLLSKKYNIPHISLGALLREKAKENSELGKYIKKCLDDGVLVDEQITIEIAINRLNAKDCRNGYILDGYPRSVKQAELYEKFEKRDKIVIFLDISEEEALKRINNRITCPKCGKIFTATSLAISNICDVCYTPLAKRSDDNAITFKNRYFTYLAETAALIEYYKNKNFLYSIDGSMSEQAIFEAIDKIINKVG
ncbi:MAG: adenylate kinase family protein [Bacilli bacterium]|jgi:adenylate kinase